MHSDVEPTYDRHGVLTKITTLVAPSFAETATLRGKEPMQDTVSDTIKLKNRQN